MDEATRACSKCERVLPLSSGFYRDKRGPGGYHSQCKDCRIAVNMARYWAKRDEIRAKQAVYRADPEHRRIDREKSARWRAENPESARAQSVAYRARPENRERLQQYIREWRLAHPELLREYSRRREARKRQMYGGGKFPRDLLAAKLAYWGYRCWIAGPTCAVEPDQWDHVKPLSRGGLHLLANLRPACKPCNSSKKARWPYPVTGGPTMRLAT